MTYSPFLMIFKTANRRSTDSFSRPFQLHISLSLEYCCQGRSCL